MKKEIFLCDSCSSTSYDYMKDTWIVIHFAGIATFTKYSGRNKDGQASSKLENIGHSLHFCCDTCMLEFMRQTLVNITK